MALTATATQGFEDDRITAENETIFVPGNPGDTFTAGNRVIMSNGVLVEASGSSANAVGEVVKTVTCPDAGTYGFPNDRSSYSSLDAIADTLVQIRPTIAAGKHVKKTTFAGHWDDTVVSYTVGTRALALTTGMTADDYPNGGLLYVYDGTGAGQWNVVEDYDHAGGAANLLLITHRKFETALDSTSKIIVLGGEAVASAGIGFFGRMDLNSASTLHVADGYDDGDYAMLADAHTIVSYLKNLTVPNVDAREIY